jgi:hypothetical protein
METLYDQQALPTRALWRVVSGPHGQGRPCALGAIAMIGLLGLVLAAMGIVVRVRRRLLFHVPRALLLAEGLPEAIKLQEIADRPCTRARNSEGPRRGKSIVWPALTEYGLATFENAHVPDHRRCSCAECRDAAALRDLAGIERRRRRHEGSKIVMECARGCVPCRFRPYMSTVGHGYLGTQKLISAGYTGPRVGTRRAG